MMRVLIAGWQGQVAKALAELASVRPEISALAIGRPALDLCNAPSIRRALFQMSPDVVINTAAYTHVDKAESEPELAFQLNAAGAADLAGETAKKHIPIVHLSTDYVFDGKKDGPYTEDDVPAPASVYGRSKLQGEAAVACANPKHLILRTAWVYSPHGRNFVKTMIQRAGENSKIDVVDDQVGSPTYAQHLADRILSIAIQVASGQVAAPWGIYHAAGAGTVSWCGLAEQVFKVSRKLGGPAARLRPIKTLDYPTAAPRPRNSQLDCTKLERVFGVRMPDWREGVEDCVRRLLSDGLKKEIGV